MRDFFTLNKSEQRGIVALLIIILLLSVLNLAIPAFFAAKKGDFSVYDREVTQFLQAQKALSDSLKLIQLQNAGKLNPEQASAKLHPFPFDPNRLTDGQWLKMGFTARQVKTIRHYLAKGGCFRKKEDLKKIRCISEAEYDVLEPFIHLSPTATAAGKKYSPRKIVARQSVEINSADTKALTKKLLLPSWLAARILKYRTLLGGYYSPEQLLEVYGMKPASYHTIKNFVRIDTSKIKRVNLNTATFKQLLHHPYIDYETTKKLLNARNRTHGFNDFHEVKEATGLPDSLLTKIRHYLYLRPLKINRNQNE